VFDVHVELVACATAGHAAQSVPHAAVDRHGTHDWPSPLFCQPASHAKSHAPEAQVALAFAGAGHAVQRAPHESGESFGWHALPHA
jgi:hypothetical protein